MAFERVTFDNPAKIVDIDKEKATRVSVYDADVFNEGHSGQVLRELLAGGEYQILPQQLDETVPLLTRLHVFSNGNGAVIRKPRITPERFVYQGPGYRINMPESMKVFPVVVLNSETSQMVLQSLFIWKPGLNPDTIEGVVQHGFNWRTEYPELPNR